MNRTQLVGALFMLTATLLYGLGGAIISTMEAEGMGFTFVILFTSGLAFATWGLRAKEPDGQRMPIAWATIGLISFLSAINGLLYFLALRLAPVGPAAALHLVAPLLLMMWAVMRRQRKLGSHELLTLALLAGGAAMATLLPGATAGGSHPLVGLTAAFASAVCVALTVSLTKLNLQRIRLRHLNGIGSLLGSLLLLPFWLNDPPSLDESLKYMAMSLFIYVPATACGWQAIKRLSPTTTTSVLLLEAVFTPLAALALFATAFYAQQALAMALILGAALMEVLRESRQETSDQVAAAEKLASEDAPRG